MGKIKLLIADDHAIVRQGLIKIIQEDPDIEVIDEASDGREALEKVRSKKFDVVILDLSMPEMSGLDCLKQIKAEFPNLPVLVFSMHPEDQYEQRVLSAGASGYLTKRIEPEKIIKVIREVAAGKKVLSEKIKERLINGKKISAEPHLELSDREFQVMVHIARGLRAKEIAYKLGISDKTISTYRRRIFEKLNCSSNADIVRYCIEHNINYSEEDV